MNIPECFLIQTYVLCFFVNLHQYRQTDVRVPACSLTFYHTLKTQMTQGSVLFAWIEIILGDRNIFKFIIQTINPKIQNGRIHANCINIYWKIHHYELKVKSEIINLNLFFSNSNFCCLLITLANNFVPDQD